MDPFVILRVVQVVLGIGLVIFVHEAGHFIAARLCKVQVEVFSLGFGPPLLSWKRGGTIYQIAMVPLGGFVKMLGDEPTQEGRKLAREQEQTFLDDAATERAKQDSELGSKSVGQRFFIYSGGVLMNMAFAVIIFPILFAVGVPFTKPLIDPVPGGVAWQAGIAPGSTVDAINGRDVFEFGHIQNSVALSDPDHVELMVRAPGQKEASRFVLQAQPQEQLGFYGIGVRVGLDPEATLEIPEDSAAWKSGLRTGMKLLGVEGVSNTLDPYDQLAMAYEARGDLVVRALDGTEQRTFTVVPEFSEELSPPRLGIRPPDNYIAAVRPNSDVSALGLKAGDKVVEIAGRPIFRRSDWLDALVESDEPIRMTVEREQERGEVETLELALPAELGVLTRERRRALFEDLAVTLDRATCEIIVTQGEGGYEAGLRDGDAIVEINGQKIGDWDDIYDLLTAAGKIEAPVNLEVFRRLGEEEGYLQLTATMRGYPRAKTPYYGILSSPSEYTYKAAGVAEALRVGLDCSWRFVEDTWLTLKSMLVDQRVSPKNMGGIILISQVSYSVSEQGLSKLFFFLCMLSINLAILNVLPIPVLDGGHLFFLLIEKLKGSPVSDRVLGYSQMVGLVLILSLMVYVTFNDITRFFLQG